MLLPLCFRRLSNSIASPCSLPSFCSWCDIVSLDTLIALGPMFNEIWFLESYRAKKTKRRPQRKDYTNPNAVAGSLGALDLVV